MPALRAAVLALASALYIGYIPYKIVPFKKWKGGGLLASVAGWGLLWAMPPAGPLFWAATLSVLALSVPLSHFAEKWLSYDDPRIVIDEVAGVWIACLALPRAAGPMLAGLVLFRVFDVWKGPWGRAAARLPGGWGVVADDLLAGVIANLGARALAAVVDIPSVGL